MDRGKVPPILIIVVSISLLIIFNFSDDYVVTSIVFFSSLLVLGLVIALSIFNITKQSEHDQYEKFNYIELVQKYQGIENLTSKLPKILPLGLFSYFFIFGLSFYIVAINALNSQVDVYTSYLPKLLTDSNLGNYIIVPVFPLLLFLSLIGPIFLVLELYVLFYRLDNNSNKSRYAILKELNPIDKMLGKKLIVLVGFHLFLGVLIGSILVLTLEPIIQFSPFLGQLMVVMFSSYLYKKWFDAILIIAMDIGRDEFLKMLYLNFKAFWVRDLFYAVIATMLLFSIAIIGLNYNFLGEAIFLLYFPVFLPITLMISFFENHNL